MATWSEKKIQRFADSFKQLNSAELTECRKLIQTYEPETRDGKCSFLDLPAEIRNMIYHRVAADAHASTAVLQESRLMDCTNVMAVRDKDGRKIRPGFFGTCREIFQEFHSIFYSPVYVRAKVLMRQTTWETVTNSAMLDAIVNLKHMTTVNSYGNSKDDLEALIANREKRDTSLYGGRQIVLSNGSTTFVFFAITLTSPWVNCWGATVHEWTMSHSCLTTKSATRVPKKEDRCAACLVSMGPERAASETRRYSTLL